LRSSRISLIVALMVLCIVAASLYAIADSCKSGCGGNGAACGQRIKVSDKPECSQQGACNATSAYFSGGKVVTRAYYDGTVKMRVGACPRNCSLTIAVLKQGDRPDANASVFAGLRTPQGRQPVSLQQIGTGVFCAKVDLTGATAVDMTVSGGGALSSVVSFDLPASATCGQAAGKCGAMGGGCPMSQGAACPMSKQPTGCKATADCKCTGMAAGGCATAGACKQAGKTAACKCGDCKCAPCKCK
jgi:hypothetical protein